ncbi:MULTISPECIES: DUF305 domain-containing protein [unclassified Crossiella]|uniref:DUF305 domain-containing protein n=1 Tax=unclassified Crossiella TaxID=2620835 RepID=UPI001FFEA335|nr:MULTISPECIES: DUF305 domain-containing protein [unclassified Crossiella]MCK2245336.1 DUF305 domain-containing protein [Crossiella sp. S99.2]MCK2258962.1 DUF305 domain-containing protein [Crossiella sp. S99.1]
MRKNKLVLAGLGVLTAITLSACGGGTSSGHNDGHAGGHPATSAPAADAGHNAADITFAQGMIPHHQQALDMSKLVPTRTDNAKVRDLAKRIQDGQQPEIDTMTGWLKSWNAPVQPEHGGGHGAHGMMSAEAMKELTAASKADFDKRWLTMMVEHHRGAVEMAKTELAQGQSAAAKHLAEEVISAQEKEIAEMTGLLKG